ncbi:MAG: Crp/Fnr family transcriptional regulator [Bacteroidota bacterium]
MNPLLSFINTNVSKLSGETLGILEEAFVRRKVKKGERFLSQGETCRHLYFLAEGICRSYSLKEDIDITTWFSFKDEFFTSFTSFFPDEPSYENMEMLTDGIVYQISKAVFDEIRTQSIEIERVINHFSLLYTIQLEKRLFLIQTYTAREKYELLLQQEPHLVQFVSNKHLASYLGITRETLSRIRSSIN